MRNLNNYVNECMEELDTIGIEYGNIIEVKVNTRAQRRWGQCKVVSDGYSINISSVLLDERNPEKALKETIIHELLHTCKDCMDHGNEWKRLAAKVNRVYGYNIKRCTSTKDNGVKEETRSISVCKPKYIIKCNQCNHIYTRYKTSKLIQHPEYYRCGCCKGTLSLV